MIKINLLPPELQGKKARFAAPKGPSGPFAGNLLIALVTLAAVVLCGLSGLYVWSKISDAKQRLEETTQKLAKKQRTYNILYKDLKDMKDRYDRMKDQKEILDVLMPPDRILWSMKLNMLSNLIPQGVYITKITLSEATELVETASSEVRRKAWKAAKEKQDQAKAATPEEGGEAAKQKMTLSPASRPGGEILGPEPEMVKKPVITQAFTIDAVSTGQTRDDRFDKMLEFERALGKYEMKDQQGKVCRFMDSFQPDVNFGPMEASVLDEVEVWSFQIILKTKKFGLETKSDDKVKAKE